MRMRKMLSSLAETPGRIRRRRRIAADAVVVLGAAVWPGGVPSPALRRRAQHGARVCLERNAGLLLLTGGVGRHPPSEASVMQRIARTGGVPQERILLEEESTTTYGSVRRCSRTLRRRKLRRIIVVTDAYHLFRSVFLFRLQGLDAVGEPVPEAAERVPSSVRLRRLLREAVALVWYLLRIAAAGPNGGRWPGTGK